MLQGSWFWNPLEVTSIGSWVFNVDLCRFHRHWSHPPMTPGRCWVTSSAMALQMQRLATLWDLFRKKNWSWNYWNVYMGFLPLEIDTDWCTIVQPYSPNHFESVVLHHPVLPWQSKTLPVPIGSSATLAAARWRILAIITADPKSSRVIKDPEPCGQYSFVAFLRSERPFSW